MLPVSGFIFFYTGRTRRTDKLSQQFHVQSYFLFSQARYSHPYTRFTSCTVLSFQAIRLNTYFYLFIFNKYNSYQLGLLIL